MLFDLSMTELMLIGVVALVVIGPKDLPKALKVAGFWVRKARTLSREFQSSVEQMIREAELDEVRQELKKASEFDVEKEFRNTIDPTGSLAEGLKPPELPKFSGADLPASAPPTGVPVMPEAIEGEAAAVSATPAAPAPDAATNLPQGETAPPDFTVAPAEAGAQGNGRDPAAPLDSRVRGNGESVHSQS